MVLAKKSETFPSFYFWQKKKNSQQNMFEEREKESVFRV